MKTLRCAMQIDASIARPRALRVVHPSGFTHSNGWFTAKTYANQRPRGAPPS